MYSVGSSVSLTRTPKPWAARVSAAVLAWAVTLAGSRLYSTFTGMWFHAHSRVRSSISRHIAL